MIRFLLTFWVCFWGGLLLCYSIEQARAECRQRWQKIACDLVGLAMAAILIWRALG